MSASIPLSSLIGASSTLGSRVCSSDGLGIVLSVINFHMLLQSWLDYLKSPLNILSGFCSSQNYLSGSKNQKANLWLLQMVNQSRKCFGAEIAIFLMIAIVKLFKFDFEAYRATGDHVLNFELGEFDVISTILNCFRVVFSC